VNWKRDIALAAGGERHLARSIERLEGALKAFALYRTAERLASTDPEPGHREFYRSVSYLLAECPDRETFRHLLREKCEGLSRSPGSSGDGTRLPDYFQTLDALVGDDDGFALLRLLKDSRSGCRSAIGLVADELDRVERQESPLEPAIANSLPEREQTFVHLKPILDLPESEFFAGAFGKILRYIALERRYGGAFDKYEESVVLMGEWYLSYQVVSAIRKEYPPADYRQPKTFRLTVPGLELYRMYGDSANYPIGEGVVEL
jgi:hypothetical protein